VSTPQESDPPDVRLAIAVTLILLDDVWAQLKHADGDDHDVAQLLLRIAALRSVLRRAQAAMKP
jgi:hypothetical protein